MGLRLLKVILLLAPLLGFSFPEKPQEILKYHLYKKGIEYAERGNYIGALEIFHFLGNYRDSRQLYREVSKFFSPVPTTAFKREPLIRVKIGNFSDFELLCPDRVERVYFRVPKGGFFRRITYRGKTYKTLNLKGQRGCKVVLNGFSYGKLPLNVEITLTEYRNSAIAVLNLPLEFYLKGVLPSEVYTDWPLEALKAQAVASRTYALFNIYRAREAGRPFDVDSSINYQAFRIPQKISPRVNLAVEETKGQVLTYGGSLIYAMFHSNSGGCTHSFKEITGLDLPYLAKVREKCDLKNLKWTHWNRRLSKRRVEYILSNLVGEFFYPTSVEIKRNSCGRGLLITFTSRRRERITLPLSVFFRMEAKLPSDWFYILGKSGRYFLLSGRGFGHGLGMSQWGDYCLSKMGWNYKRILRFYYRGTKVEKLY